MMCFVLNVYMPELKNPAGFFTKTDCAVREHLIRTTLAEPAVRVTNGFANGGGTSKQRKALFSKRNFAKFLFKTKMFYKDIQSIIDEYAFHLNVADEYKKLNDKYNLKKIYTDYVMEYMLKYSQKLEENWQILDCYEKCYEEFLKTDSDIKIYSKYINLLNSIYNNKYMHVEYEYKFIEN